MAAGGLPSNGNFASGQLIWRSNPAPGTSIRWVCIANGSLDEIGVVHGAIEGGSSTLTVTDASTFAVGSCICLEGLPDAAKIIAIDGHELTLNRVALRGTRGRVLSLGPGQRYRTISSCLLIQIISSRSFKP
ncbi:hypothetical protein R75483_06308 [Paraburkholderia domus]|nr:hypothetical protein R75483_06308 [Paraburkholderia domus]